MNLAQSLVGKSQKQKAKTDSESDSDSDLDDSIFHVKTDEQIKQQNE